MSPPFETIWRDDPATLAPARPARRRSAQRHHAGLAAEEAAIRAYKARGAEVLERRLRTPEGELDLVLDEGGTVVFVEVKHRGRPTADSPISERQWQRLGNAATWYIMRHQEMTGTCPFCRFDAAIGGPGGTLEIIENARSF